MLLMLPPSFEHLSLWNSFFKGAAASSQEETVPTLQCAQPRVKGQQAAPLLRGL